MVAAQKEALRKEANFRHAIVDPPIFATGECRAATVRESVGPDTTLPSLPPHHYPAEHHYQGQHELTYRAQHQELGASQVNAAVFLVFRTDRNEIFIRRQPIQHV